VAAFWLLFFAAGAASLPARARREDIVSAHCQQVALFAIKQFQN
jgi:hypothetical protein